jgi:hypothetical protein
MPTETCAPQRNSSCAENRRDSCPCLQWLSPLDTKKSPPKFLAAGCLDKGSARALDGSVQPRFVSMLLKWRMWL